MYLVGINALLGNHVLMTYHQVQLVILVLNQILEVVVDGVGIAEAVTVS